jgi:hypothetical protein
MNAPTRRRNPLREPSTQSPFEADVRIRRLRPTVLGSSDPAFEIRDGGRHLRVSRKGYAPDLDLDGSHTAKPGDKQRVPLPGHFLKVIWLGLVITHFIK